MGNSFLQLRSEQLCSDFSLLLRQYILWPVYSKEQSCRTRLELSSEKSDRFEQV